MNDGRTTGPFVGPTGRVLHQADLKLIRDLERNGTVAWSEEEVVFNSGFKSRVYFSGRRDLTQNVPLLMKVARQAKEHIEALKNTHGPQKNLIGIPMAGSPLAQAVSTCSCLELERFGRKSAGMCFSPMRSVLKEGHGKKTDHMWVGPPELDKYTYITVENVVSTAKAMLESFGRLEQDGYPTRQMHHFVFADWELGGMQTLAVEGYSRVHVRYSMRDIMAALAHMEAWPPERYDEMDRHIKAWNAANPVV